MLLLNVNSFLERKNHYRLSRSNLLGGPIKGVKFSSQSDLSLLEDLDLNLDNLVPQDNVVVNVYINPYSNVKDLPVTFNDIKLNVLNIVNKIRELEPTRNSVTVYIKVPLITGGVKLIDDIERKNIIGDINTLNGITERLKALSNKELLNKYRVRDIHVIIRGLNYYLNSCGKPNEFNGKTYVAGYTTVFNHLIAKGSTSFKDLSIISQTFKRNSFIGAPNPFTFFVNFSLDEINSLTVPKVKSPNLSKAKQKVVIDDSDDSYYTDSDESESESLSEIPHLNDNPIKPL